MILRTLQILVCAASLISLQGCFFWHTTDHDRPAAQTTTVTQPGDAVVTTTH